MMRETLFQILELARWAPSGDNTQPWRFEIVSDDHVIVHCFDDRDRCVYDIDGRPSQIAFGALLENIAIAASTQQLTSNVCHQADSPEKAPRFDIRFATAPDKQPDALSAHITRRSVYRRPLSLRPLTDADKSSLQSAVAPSMRVVWLEGFENRRKAAALLFRSAKIRLTIPEAYTVHRSAIAWDCQFSEDRVPDRAIGLDPLTLKLMAWVMQSWSRVEFFNKFLAGTVLPRVQLDLVPGMMCAAHFALVPRERANTIADFVATGRAVQRLWLTATSLDLQLQPEMTPLIFSAYARQGTQFTQVAAAIERARDIRRRFAALIGEEQAAAATFFGRLGHGSTASARSTRRPLESLMYRPGQQLDGGVT